MKEIKPHLHEYKLKEVESIKGLFSTYKVAGILNLEFLPAYQLQKIKKSIRGKVIIKFSRKDFMEKALDRMNIQNYEKLKENLVGVPAMLFTNEDPFMLYKLIEKSRSSAPARPGQLSPDDIIIPAGPTSFTPGPMIGELGQLGIKSEVKDGKINIREDKVIVKKGQEISTKIADLLPKFGILPMKIGLNILLTYQNGEILTKDILAVDEAQYILNIKESARDSLLLALQIGYAVPETIKTLLSKAYFEAKAIADKVKFEEIAQDQASAEPDVSSQPEPVLEPEPVPEVAPEPQPESVQETIKEPQMAAAQPAVFNEVKIESRPEINEDNMKKAQEILTSIMDKAVSNITTGAEKFQEQKINTFKNPDNFDVNKFINKLKDQKSMGKL